MFYLFLIASKYMLLCISLVLMLLTCSYQAEKVSEKPKQILRGIETIETDISLYFILESACSYMKLHYIYNLIM